MRLASVTIARDEADIIELFVRHTLNFVDRMYVVDDGSSDATAQILRLLAGEGLPVTVIQAGTTSSYQQGLRTTALMARAMAEESWDFVLPLDADEFITATDRRHLQADLAALPQGSVGAFALRQHVPLAEDGLRVAGPRVDDQIARMAHVLDLPRHPNKVVVPGALAAHPETLLSDGNHMVSRYQVELPSILLARSDLAHFPIRTMEQLAAKCLVSYVRWRARSDYESATAAHHIAGTQALAEEPALALSDPDRLLQAYLPEIGSRICHEPFQVKGTCQYPHLARTFPYRRVLGSLDALVERSRSDAREMAAMRKKLQRTEPLLSRANTFARKLRRSVMKRYLALRQRYAACQSR